MARAISILIPPTLIDRSTLLGSQSDLCSNSTGSDCGLPRSASLPSRSTPCAFKARPENPLPDPSLPPSLCSDPRLSPEDHPLLCAWVGVDPTGLTPCIGPHKRQNKSEAFLEVHLVSTQSYDTYFAHGTTYFTFLLGSYAHYGGCTQNVLVDLRVLYTKGSPLLFRNSAPVKTLARHSEACEWYMVHAKQRLSESRLRPPALTSATPTLGPLAGVLLSKRASLCWYC